MPNAHLIFLPITNERLSLLTRTKASCFFSSVINTFKSLAGLKAFSINLAGSLSYKMTSIFSPFNSLIMRFIRVPFSPIHEPTASILEFSE